VSADHGESTTSRVRKPLIVTAGVLLVVAITVFGVLQLMPDADSASAPTTEAPPPQLTAADVTNQFLDALTEGRAEDAGRLTDGEAAATAQLAAVWQSLAPTSATASRTMETVNGAAADEKFTLSWQWGTDRTWSYDSALHLVQTEAGWRVHWQPALVHPRLAAGQSLAMRDGSGQPAVVDQSGTPLVNWAADKPTPADLTVAPRLLGALGRVASGQGTAGGWYVAVIDAAGAEVEVVHGTHGAPLVSSVSVPVQKAAQAAVDTQSQPTMLVALRPSTGDILAVAQNGAAGTEPTALNGLYPPGSTFKIATATALIEGGVADVNTVVPCPATTTVGKRTVENAGRFALPDGPLRTAFAKSCNTTFAEQSAKLPSGALSAAADQLGLGADFEIPGITTEMGSVPVPENSAQQVENSIGQGTVQTSCFGLALMTATVSAGGAVTPRLWRDLATTATVPYTAPPAGVVRSLRTMMREVVTSGRATALSGYGTVFGKTGTAEFGTGDQAHGWFAGYRDDVAFAVLVVDGSTSEPAVAVTGRFLGALG
jgi:Penicillin binding protein transpeptidase domain/NTF2-like N-terminal transpeptidase domain